MRTAEQRDVDLEHEIDAVAARVTSAPDEAAAAPHMTELAMLMRRRSTAQQLKLEFERRLALQGRI